MSKCQVDTKQFYYEMFNLQFKSIRLLPQAEHPNFDWFKIGQTHRNYESAYLVVMKDKFEGPFWFIYRGTHEANGEPYIHGGQYNRNFYSLEDILDFLTKHNDQDALDDLLFNLDIFQSKHPSN